MLTRASLDGRTAVVTGGARGIGLARATRPAGAGTPVTVVDRGEAGADATGPAH